MPVLIGFLAYTIVKFKAFNIKLLGAQALVVSLIVLIGSQFFFIQNPTNKILNGITFLFALIFGYFLVRSVKSEVEQREKIEKQEKALGAANARLKELDQLKSEFVSLATHQIRGPISAIKGYASMLLEGDYGPVEGSVREPIQTIATSSAALAGIVQDFLDVSRIEQGKMKYEFTVFDFGKLARSVAEELASAIERKGLRVKLDVLDHCMVHADAGKLRQVIENLIDNAQKYTKQGTITIRMERTADRAKLSVKDNGIGIAPETLPKLFRKFSRAEDASKANIRGTGLGLYVARQLIEAQGGSIRAESEGEGKGSTFTVELPLHS
jgi:signal transduction histidine kinase